MVAHKRNPFTRLNITNAKRLIETVPSIENEDE